VSERLDDVVEALRTFVRLREWSRYHDPKNLAMAVASETGELLELFRWVHSEEADAICGETERRRRVEDEIGDVGLCLLMLCDRLDVDFFEALERKLEKNREKFLVEEVRGGRTDSEFDA